MVQVAVVDPHEPVFAVGLIEVLRREGHEAELCERFDDHSPRARGIVILGVGDVAPGDLDDEVGTGIGLPASRPVLLLASCVGPAIVRVACRLGFAGAVSRRSGPEAVCAAVTAASAGHFVLPVDVASAAAVAGPPRRLTDSEVMLLAALATSTIGEAACQLGYSRRHTQRLVSRLLDDLDLPDTRSAVLAAGAWNLVAVPRRAPGLTRRGAR